MEVFSFTSGEDMPSQYFDKKGNFVGAPKKGDGIIRVRLEKSGRGGKTVTVAAGFDLSDDINELCSALKKKAGCGGSTKNGSIEIQGDKRELVMQFLKDKGFKVK
jgi:translation initiation factor 1